MRRPTTSPTRRPAVASPPERRDSSTAAPPYVASRARYTATTDHVAALSRSPGYRARPKATLQSEAATAASTRARKPLPGSRWPSGRRPWSMATARAQPRQKVQRRAPAGRLSSSASMASPHWLRDGGSVDPTARSVTSGRSRGSPGRRRNAAASSATPTPSATANRTAMTHHPAAAVVEPAPPRLRAAGLRPARARSASAGTGAAAAGLGADRPPIGPRPGCGHTGASGSGRATRT